MATANQNSSAPNKSSMHQRWGLHKDSPQSVTPQNFKISSHIQTTKGEAAFLDTAKTSTKSQSGPGATNKQIMTLQNSQIHGRKVDSPKIYINESDIQDSRPKTSAQCNRKIKNKRSKVPQVPTPANIEKKLKSMKKEKTSSNANAQNTSGSCLTIFPAHPISSRKPQQRFDFTFNQEKDELEAGAHTAHLPITEREVKRKHNSNIHDMQNSTVGNGTKEQSNTSTAQLSQNTGGMSKYQQSRQMGTRAKSSGANGKNVKGRHLSQSIQLGVTSVKPSQVNQSLTTPNQLSTHPSAFSQNQSTLQASKISKNTRQPKYSQQSRVEETSRGRQTRSSDQKSRPTLAAASKKGMTIRKSKLQKSTMSSFANNYNHKSQSQGATGGNNRYRKSSSIESQSKLHGPPTACDAKGQFSFDLDNKENYPSNSSLHQNKSKPLSEQSKSVSAGRSRVTGGRNQRLHQDLSLSSLSRSSRNLKVEASGGSLSKMLHKAYFVDGEHMLKILSPGPANNKSENLRKRDLDPKMLSVSRTSSPTKGISHVQTRSSRHQQKSVGEVIKQSLDSKSGDLRHIRPSQPQVTSVGELTSNSKHPGKKTLSTEKQIKHKNLALEQFKRYMEETSKKTDKEVKRVKDVDQSKMHEILHSKQKTKKKRSKSCISKINDQVLSWRDPRERSKESNDRSNIDTFSGNFKQKKESSCIGELNKLKNELQMEIQRERNIITPSNKVATNTSKNADQLGRRKQSDTTQSNKFHSLRLTEKDRNLISSQLNPDPKLAADKASSAINKQKIQRYIEKQKKQAIAKKNMRDTIEHDKLRRINDQLIELQKLPKKKMNKTSRLTKPQNLTIKQKQASETGLNSSQRIQLENQVKNHSQPAKLLKSQNCNPLRKAKKRPSLNDTGKVQSHMQEASYINYDSQIRDDKYHELDEPSDSERNPTYHGGGAVHSDSDDFDDDHHSLGQYQQDSSCKIIDIFTEKFPHSNGKSKRDQQYSPQTEMQPLREIRPKVQTTGQQQNQQKPTKKTGLQLHQPNIQTTEPGYHSLHNQRDSSISNPIGNSEQFESLEPSRYPTEKPSGPGTQSSQSKQGGSNIYESEIQNDRKHGLMQLSNDAATIIQRWWRDYLEAKRYWEHQQHLQQQELLLQQERLNNQQQQQQVVPEMAGGSDKNQQRKVPTLPLYKMVSTDSQNQGQNPYDNGPANKPKEIQMPKESLSARSKTSWDKKRIIDLIDGAPIVPNESVNISSIPELIKIREEAIRKKELEDQQLLQQQLDHKVITPRTHTRKQRDLERWVTAQNDSIQKQKDMHMLELNGAKPGGALGLRSKVEDQKTGKYLDQYNQNSDQLQIILGSARTNKTNNSQRSKQPLKYADEYPDNPGLSSFRNSQSQRRSHRAENQIIQMINEVNNTKPYQDDSSHSQQPRKKGDDRQKNLVHIDENASISDSQAYDSRSRHTYTSQDEYSQDPHQPTELEQSLDQVDVAPPEQKPAKGHKELAIEHPSKLLQEKSDASLKRQLSQQKLQATEPDLLPTVVDVDQPQKSVDNTVVDKPQVDEKPAEPARKPQPSTDSSQQSPRQLNKIPGLSSLHDKDEHLDNLKQQVYDVEQNPSSDGGSHKNFQEDLMGIHNENYFTRVTDKNQSQSQEQPYQPNSNAIRLELDGQQQTQNNNSALVGTISPLSGASSDFKIDKGGMSLESSTSGENREKLQMLISEIHNEAPSNNNNTNQSRTDSTNITEVPVEDTDGKDIQKQEPKPEEIQTTLEPRLQQYAEALSDEIMKLLVAELRYDFELLVNRDQAQQQQQQQEQLQAQQQLQGIKTDLFAIERYVDEIVEEIKQNAPEFLKTLNTPLSKDHVALLKQLHDTEVGSCEHFEEQYPMVLPLELYLTLEKRRKEKQEQQNAEQRQANPPAAGATTSLTESYRVLIAECEHIHNKVLFDCINDSLLQFKPYGKEGEPLPWTRKNRRLKPSDDFNVEEVFEIVKHDLFRWAITQAGTLPRREFVYRGVFDEELFSEIREKKLVALLGREMQETEPRWLNYEFEQAQVKIDLENGVLEVLVTECINELKRIEEERANEDLSEHPLMKMQAEPQDEERKDQSPGKREFQYYEEHLLWGHKEGGREGGKQSRPNNKNSQDHSGYNSNDNDFDNMGEADVDFNDDDFGGNQSQNDSNSQYESDEFE